MKNAVGPVLKIWGGRAELVVSAIRDDNPDVAVDVIDYGRHICVRAPDFLRVTRATIEWHLGRSFEMSSLDSIMVSFDGQITEFTDEITWHHPTAPSPRN
ncbi:MmoB/DmpM family protein [Pseudonocardia bannensis]|uniref:Monooxygenase n=1 Tax=Pseudonocardia bannensis TaxID=630973 RepID=A0A848DMD1_9PSEU|nr:MmoB/DmpM family protein [Pseudonocardia bannensis]NMH93591.1 monooxygenase [Pseudonocardia bannensis]